MAKVKQVKFSAKEMAEDAPVEVDFSSGLVIRGTAAWKRFLSAKRGYAHLAPDVRKAFPDDKWVNAALRSFAKANGFRSSRNGIRQRGEL